MEPFISGITQLFFDFLSNCAGFYHIVYDPNPITKPNGFDNPLPISKPNCFHQTFLITFSLFINVTDF